MRELRFAGACVHGRSRSWKVKTSASKRDVYISRDGAGQYAHVSLHGETDWHLALEGHSGADRFRDLPVAPDIHPGVRHAVSIVIGQSACLIQERLPPRVNVVSIGPDPASCAVIDIFLISRDGLEVRRRDPAQSWALAMADGARAQVIATQRAFEPFRFDIDAPADALEGIRNAVADGLADYLMVFGAPSGPLTIVDAAMHPADRSDSRNTSAS